MAKQVKPTATKDTYLYFAYGSNMSSDRLRARTPSANPLGKARLPGYTLRWHKLGRDGSGKCDIEPSDGPGTVIWGVLYEINRAEKGGLDAAEGLGVGYDEHTVRVETGTVVREAITYKARPDKIDPALRPLDWYKTYVIRGATEHGLPDEYVRRIAAVRVRYPEE
ncbi:MAG: gamma-glutamylcyclotransferase [Gammaproteobacteria bacterium]|nr:gamma-glutamylcyclotransferase [Gammaproteobacteria bacterium]MDE0190212.1 gamma-glutamylcyclotransferase [Gammaproteobacteria bacterium]